MTTTNQEFRVSLALTVAALLAWASPATAEDCGSPCTVTRQGLPTFRLVNTAGVDDWDLETSAFGVELAPMSDSPNTGAFRVEHDARPNTLVIDYSGRVGINTTLPKETLQISSISPGFRLHDISSGARSLNMTMNGDIFTIGSDADGFTKFHVEIDTRAPTGSLRITESGSIGIGTAFPGAKLHVNGDARVDGNVSLGSSRALKTAFEPVSPSDILAKLADLPVASWCYKTEDESTRHIGPFAEDFQRLFGLGDGKTISIVDAQGVAFAAIQGLEQRLAEKEDELADLRSEKDAQIAELLARLTTVEKRLDAKPSSSGRRASGGPQ